MIKVDGEVKTQENLDTIKGVVEQYEKNIYGGLSNGNIVFMKNTLKA